MSEISRTLLIDGDIIAYHACCASYRAYEDPEEGISFSVNSFDEAVSKANRIIDSYARKLRADHVIVCLSDDLKSFRKAENPAYKSARKGERPVHLYDLKDALAAGWSFLRWPWLEADDVMGIMSTRLSPGERRCIVSVDKDLEGVPGWLFNPMKDNKARLVTPVEADRRFMAQVLTGDPVDGYPGCPGVGPKSRFVKALGEVETPAEMWEIVLEGYASKGLTEADAVLQARMAFILRDGFYDPDANRPILWTPQAFTAGRP